MKRRETFAMAVRAVKSNRLRSWLTITIIALGITSLVGILTAVDAIRSSIIDTYSRMGTAAIIINSRYSYPSDMKRHRNPLYLSKVQAERFKEYYDVDATVSMYAVILSNARAESGAKRTNPTVTVVGCDDNMLATDNLSLAEGRNFKDADIRSGKAFCIIGSGVSSALYGDGPASGKPVFIKGRRYTVVGVAEKVGNMAGGSMDDRILVPYTNALADLCESAPDFTIKILPDAAVPEEFAASEARKNFRAARRLSPWDEDDFNIVRMEAEIRSQNESIYSITVMAMVIGLITLTGAAVGLMNIMLVSVKERTREIGTLKALGASSSGIRQQFLLESVLIGETGGIIGIVAGIVAGNITAAIMDAGFTIPWHWMAAAFVLCPAVGILSGYLPAKRAAALDPIECLRYE